MKQRGFTLVELIIAMLVLATGVVGSIALQSTAKKNSFDAIQRAKATSLAHDIIERIRGNTSQLAAYAGTTYGKIDNWENVKMCHMAAADDIAPSCTSAELATYDTYQWDQALKGTQVTKTVGEGQEAQAINVGGLIDPTGCVIITSSGTGAGMVTVAVSWSGRFSTKDAEDTTGIDCGTESKSRRQVTMSAYIFQES